jgi:molybdopterin-guanine dinucleotide biosynthesis protein A
MKRDTNQVFYNLTLFIISVVDYLMQMTSIIVAGGHSRRMGTNKALLPLAGITAIEKLIRELEPLSQRILIAGGQISEYARFGKEVIADQFPGSGPLAGLHAGLSASATEWNLVVACDMPFVHRGVFEAIAEHAVSIGSEDSIKADRGVEAIIVKAGGRIQPLLAVYRRSVLPGLGMRLEEGRFRMTEWTDNLHAEYIDGAVLAREFGLTEEMLLFNMNYRADYEWAKSIVSRSGQETLRPE